ncbi:MAG: integration host factor subunit alpha [Deltaproteobacteria bacterium]|nr:integration host factor subunit alpha [Deltaproteobacteria bacterium]
MSLTKAEIVNMLYDHIGITKTECVNLFESVFEIIKDELGKGNPVKISRFGKWTVKSKKARKGRNPQTGKDVIIDARKVVTFKPSVVLKDEMND